MKTLIVIPTYNEIENLENLVTQVMNQVAQDVHVLIVDDNSPDGTGELADALSQKNNRVHVLHRAKKLGLETARFVNPLENQTRWNWTADGC